MAKPEEVSATDAARKFSQLLNRVLYRNEMFDVVRGGQKVARLCPLGQERSSTLRGLLDALESFPCDVGFADDLEAVQGEVPPMRNPWDS